MLWNPWALEGLIAGGLMILLAGVVAFAGRPTRQKWFAGLAFFAWGSVILLHVGLNRVLVDGADYFGVATLYILVYWLHPCAYLLFLSTFETRWARPLRAWWFRLGLLAYALVAIGLALLRPGWVTTSLARSPVDGRDMGWGEFFALEWLPATWTVTYGPFDAAGVWLGTLAFAWGILVAVSAWREAPPGPRREQLGRLATAVTLHDAAVLSVYAGEAFGYHVPYWHHSLAITFVPIAFALLTAYAILRTQLFDIDLRVKRTLRRSTVAAVAVGIFFVATEIAQEVFSSRLGVLPGILVAGLLVFALAPLQRFADRVADAAMPGAVDTPDYRARRKREVYRAAVETALADGDVDPRERALLATLADELGIGAREALEIETAARGARERSHAPAA